MCSFLVAAAKDIAMRRQKFLSRSRRIVDFYSASIVFHSAVMTEENRFNRSFSNLARPLAGGGGQAHEAYPSFSNESCWASRWKTDEFSNADSQRGFSTLFWHLFLIWHESRVSFFVPFRVQTEFLTRFPLNRDMIFACNTQKAAAVIAGKTFLCHSLVQITRWFPPKAASLSDGLPCRPKTFLRLKWRWKKEEKEKKDVLNHVCLR